MKKGLTILERLLLQNRLMRRLGKRSQIAVIILITLFAILLIYFISIQIKRQLILSSLENPTTINLKQFEQHEILNEIHELYPLTSKDEAVIGKITDISRLSSQHQFFSKAKNGDYLLVMPEFTLIYDRENKTVVDIARENLLDLKGEK